MGYYTHLKITVSAFKDNADGQIAVWFAILALPILAFTTFALDYTAAEKERVLLSSALDDAALAAVTRQNITNSERSQYAKNYFQQNTGNRSDINFNVIEASAQRVELKASLSVPTTISASLGKTDIQISESSVSELTYGDVICMLALDANGARSFEVTGGARMMAQDCSVQVNSKHKQAAIIDHGGVAEAKDFCVAGGAIGKFTPHINTECSIIPDPYLYIKPPKPEACMDKREVEAKLESKKSQFGQGIEFSPGTYCSGLRLRGQNVKFLPGTYVIKDGPLLFDYGSKVSAEGVTFILSGEKSRLQVAFGSSLTITAPTKGPLAGLAFFQDRSKIISAPKNFPTAESIIRSGGNVSIIGTTYLPTQKISFRGGSISRTQAPATSFIAHQISIGDGSRISVAADHQAAGLPPILPRSDEGARLAR